MQFLREFASSGTSSSLGYGFLVTLSVRRHLDGLEMRWIIEHLVVIVWWLRSRFIVRGFILTPREIAKGNSSGIKRIVGAPRSVGFM